MLVFAIDTPDVREALAQRRPEDASARRFNTRTMYSTNAGVNILP
jgi:hypothetical protein